MMRCVTCDARLPLAFPDAPCPRCALAHAVALGETTSQPIAVTHDSGRPIVDGYEPHYELGRGSMGVVWLARDVRLDRLVALKIIALGADARLEARLLREGRVIAQLRHRHIVTVHALGQSERTTFLAMDFLEGGDLQTQLNQKPMAPSAAATLIRKIADALAHAHAAGVLHRDLKPSNILLDLDSEPQLADFGLAAPLAGAGDLTSPGQAAGTPAFLAPELLVGAEQASPRSDVYGLGAVLYACVTGRAPFVGDSAAGILVQLPEREPPAPRFLNPAVPRDLETICLKCLEKNPARRYVSAEALRDDLDRFLNGEPVHARPVTAGGKILRWCRRKPALAVVSGVALLLLLVLAVGGPMTAWRMARARELAEAAQVKAHSAETRTREQLRAALLARSRATRLTGLSGQRRDALAAAEEAGRIRPGRDVRDEVIAALTLPEMTPLREWPMRTSVSQAASFDPDHDRYLVVIDSATIELHRLTDGGLVRTFNGPGAPTETGPIFSPDGRRFVIRDAKARVAVWQDDRAEPVFVLEGRRYSTGVSEGMWRPDAISPDGRVLASALAGGVSFHSTEDGRELQRITTEGEPTHVMYSPDGRLIAIGQGPRNLTARTSMFVRVFDPATRAELARLPVSLPFLSMAWSGDSTSLLVGGRELQAFDVRAARVQWVVNDRSASFGTFGPEGTLITASQGGGLTLWDPANTRPMLLAALGSQPEIQIDRASSLIAKAAGTQGRLFRLEMSSIVRSVPATANEGYANVTNHGGAELDYSPDGRWIATSPWGAVQLRDSATGKILAALALGTAGNHCSVRFEREGVSLLSGSRELGLVRVPITRLPDGTPHLGRPEPIDPEKNFVLADRSHDGRRALLVSMWRNEVKIVRVDKTEGTPVRWRLPGPGHAIFLPDDREVLVNSFEEMGRAPLQIHDAATGRERRTLDQKRGFYARISGDARWIALGTGPNESVVLRANDWAPGPPVPAGLQGEANNPTLSHDGAWLALRSGTDIALVRTADASVVARLANPRAGGYAPELAFSPDGTHLAIYWDNGLLTLWDLSTLRHELAARDLDW